MLKKLLKYEVKDTARYMLPLYGLLVVLAVLNRIFIAINLDPNTLAMGLTQGLVMTLYIVVAVAVFVITFVLIIYRFYKNLLTDEGYLMFTLPVSTWQHILSKMLVAMMWIVASTIVFTLSIFIMVLNGSALMVMASTIGEIFQAVGSEFGIAGYFLGFELLLVFVVNILAEVLHLYFAITLGQLFNKNRILAAIGAYVLINIVLQILGTIAVFVMSFNIEGLAWQFSNPVDAMPAMIGVLGLFFFIGAALSAGCFFGSNYILKNRLNLE
ncbi:MULTISPECIES: hypothetical protein [Eubacterium]|uniref:ABC-2 family transporter protein n=1 Tax=Eubacterium barkeri TaxID=1528 RepID=A0A1H3H4I5_EUBBA|nr:hypothetical protein [Eubacterium barkeri]SDY10230.1 hypothetical protein SAMN04488579_11647 [Eubacterium barkeri]